MKNYMYFKISFVVLFALQKCKKDCFNIKTSLKGLLLEGDSQKGVRLYKKSWGDFYWKKKCN